MKTGFQSVRALCLIFGIALGLLTVSARVSAQTPSSDVVLVMPFENTSSKTEYNWVGQSFSNSLSDLLTIPGLKVTSTDEREIAYQRVRLPLTTIPSRATAIKIAREARASLIVVGTYNVTPGQGDNPATLQGTARVINVNEGRLMGETMPDGQWSTREYYFGGSVTTLQAMQGRLAYQILYQWNKSTLVYSQSQFVEMANRVPQKAFEAFVKGVQTEDPELKMNYLKNALHFYADQNAGAVYPEASFELGHVYLEKNDWKNAADYFSRIQKFRDNDVRPMDDSGRTKKKEPLYPEAAFYNGLALYHLGENEKALSAMMPLTADVPLTGVYNNAGAVSLLVARDQKKPEDRDRLLAQSTQLLSRAAESTGVDDAAVHFNYAYGLFLSGKYAEAAEQLKPIIAGNPRDGSAFFLLSKALERTQKADASADADNQARRFLPTYAVWQTEWQKSQTTSNVSVRLRNVFSREDVIPILGDSSSTGEDSAGNTKDLLEKARELYSAGRDDEALTELRRVLTIEPMSAEAYLLIGRIHQRRGEQEAAISTLKTAIFWDSKMIDAHILLGKIFLEHGDRAQAMAYANSAMQIDPNNPEAVALQRQVQTGGK